MTTVVGVCSDDDITAIQVANVIHTRSKKDIEYVAFMSLSPFIQGPKVGVLVGGEVIAKAGIGSLTMCDTIRLILRRESSMVHDYVALFRRPLWERFKVSRGHKGKT